MSLLTGIIIVVRRRLPGARPALGYATASKPGCATGPGRRRMQPFGEDAPGHVTSEPPHHQAQLHGTAAKRQVLRCPHIAAAHPPSRRATVEKIASRARNMTFDGV